MSHVLGTNISMHMFSPMWATHQMWASGPPTDNVCHQLPTPSESVYIILPTTTTTPLSVPMLALCHTAISLELTDCISDNLQNTFTFYSHFVAHTSFKIHIQLKCFASISEKWNRTMLHFILAI